MMVMNEFAIPFFNFKDFKLPWEANLIQSIYFVLGKRFSELLTIFVGFAV